MRSHLNKAVAAFKLQPSRAHLHAYPPKVIKLKRLASQRRGQWIEGGAQMMIWTLRTVAPFSPVYRDRVVHMTSGPFAVSFG
jgi:hypothetical protein